jgi:hypothetical protein
VPDTALRHFREDISRARAILAHADTLPVRTETEQTLHADLLRSAWMFAVGAIDANFCDAYTDIVAATMVAKSRQDSLVLPDFFYEIKFPVRVILEEYVNENWRWRMGARKMIERETVLSCSTIQRLFNKFFRKGHKFFGDLLDGWICHPEARARRLFGVTPGAYQQMTPADKDSARRDGLEQFEKRFEEIFQRRHDCIHNCDRPRQSPQTIKASTHVLKVVEDIEFLVDRCDEHIRSEFRDFLIGTCGCASSTARSVGY